MKSKFSTSRVVTCEQMERTDFRSSEMLRSVDS